MPHVRFSRRILVAGPALAALLVVALTLVVVAQDPYDRDTCAVQGPEDCNASISTDKVTVVEEVELLPDPSAPDATFYYKFVSANTFVPYNDDMTYSDAGGGCVYRTGGTRFANHSLELPQGAEIDYLRIYFYDNDGEYNPGVHLYAYDGSGAHDEIAHVASTGTPGQSSEVSDYISYVVDNEAEALTLILDYSLAGNSNVRICGVRVRYQYSPSITSLPLVLNGAGP